MRNESKPKENPYQSPKAVDETSSAPRSYLNVALIAAILMTSLLLLGVLLTRGRMFALFEDFGVRLPIMTLVTLHPLVPAVLLGLLLFTVLKEFAISSRRRAGLLNWLICLLAIVFGTLYAAAFYFPLMSLIDNLR